MHLLLNNGDFPAIAILVFGGEISCFLHDVSSVLVLINQFLHNLDGAEAQTPIVFAW